MKEAKLKFKVLTVKEEITEPCDYCEGKGWKEASFFEEYEGEEVKMAYSCPKCLGSGRIPKEWIEKYVIQEVNYFGQITIGSNVVDVEEAQSGEIKYSFLGSLLLDENYYDLDMPKDDYKYQYFDTEEEAKEFIANNPL